MGVVVNVLALIKLNWQNKKLYFTIPHGKYVRQLLVILEQHGVIGYYHQISATSYAVHLRPASGTCGYSIEICYRHHQNYLHPYKAVSSQVYRGQRWLVLENGNLKLI